MSRSRSSVIAPSLIQYTRFSGWMHCTKKVRVDGRIISMAILIVCGVDANRFPKAVQCLEDGLEDSLAFYAFPMLDARKISSSNMIERLNREIRRRTSVIGIFPNKSSYVRLVTTYLMEYAEDWSASRVNIQRSCFSSYYCSSTAQLCGKPHSVFCTYRIFMRNIDK